MVSLRLSNHRRDVSVLKKLWQVNWGMALVLSTLACIGFSMLYSAAGGDLEPWAIKQIWRFGIGFPAMIAVAVTDIRYWYRFAYGFYGAALLLLIAVELQGVIGMGAQRWLTIGPMQLQPSELMKIALTLALARWFNDLPMQFVGRFLLLIPPLLLLALPVGLVAKQPDLGTSLMLIMSAGAIFFAAGVRWWKFVLVIAIGAVSLPFAWESNLIRDYQKARVRVFLDPGLDPLGAGYHIIQSKIALGSGGVTGKGFLQGTQSHLNFLPEKQTDFIFTMLAEEFGLIGCTLLLAMYAVLLIYGYAIAFRSTSQFGRLMALGLTTSVFLSVFINAAMVMGMIPAKGVPLPMVSYGGSSMIVTMLGFGLIMNGWIHRDTRLGQRGFGDE